MNNRAQNRHIFIVEIVTVVALKVMPVTIASIKERHIKFIRTLNDPLGSLGKKILKGEMKSSLYRKIFSLVVGAIFWTSVSIYFACILCRRSLVRDSGIINETMIMKKKWKLTAA
ncbi:hypothetical protein EV44_g4985 [Erysiphe necator]|uniref:Uncharacterized protein n=1 Tax=Uncinula necator TaxID=52586 RepID=A0A0B1P1U5_UNCNE|nr:hypothetical protein EV44_g4985 [Erysiphe necator]